MREEREEKKKIKNWSLNQNQEKNKNGRWGLVSTNLWENLGMKQQRFSHCGVVECTRQKKNVFKDSKWEKSYNFAISSLIFSSS